MLSPALNLPTHMGNKERLHSDRPDTVVKERGFHPYLYILQIKLVEMNVLSLIPWPQIRRENKSNVRRLWNTATISFLQAEVNFLALQVA